MDSIIERLWQIAYDEECVYPANPVVDDNLFIRLIDRCVEKETAFRDIAVSTLLLDHLVRCQYFMAAVHLINKLEITMKNTDLAATCEQIISAIELDHSTTWSCIDSYVLSRHICSLFPRLSLYSLYLEYKDGNGSYDEFFIKYNNAKNNLKWT